MRRIDADALVIHDVSPDYYSCVMGVTEEEINDAPTIEPEPQWIPVSERLPEVGSRVLCYCKNHVFMVGHINVCKYCAPDKYSDEPYFDYNMNGFPQVIAWMPLPKPYKEADYER